MKTRQFKQLAGKGFVQRLPLLVEGLGAIALNVGQVVAEMEVCAQAGAYRAAELLGNVATEEAGKFLILIDSCRASDVDQAIISRLFVRAGNHLAKLIYAQMADYSIASQRELVRAIELHRQELHLDGPNDFDWIFRNDLIAERESALYVDLVDSEGALGWSCPPAAEEPARVSRSIRLVDALMKTGIVSSEGLPQLQEAWRGFDPTADTHYDDWAERSRSALETYSSSRPVGEGWAEAAASVIELWPMPMVALDIAEVKVTTEDLAKRREALYEAWMAREYGWDLGDERSI